MNVVLCVIRKGVCLPYADLPIAGTVFQTMHRYGMFNKCVMSKNVINCSIFITYAVQFLELTLPISCQQKVVTIFVVVAVVP